MATQIVSPTTSNHTRFKSNRKLIERAEELFQLIGAYNDASTVRDLQQLHGYLSEFLALPRGVLATWEERGGIDE